MEKILSFKAGSDIPASHFVKFDGKDIVKVASSSTDNIIGVADTVKRSEGETEDVYLPSSIVQLTLGGTVEAGDALTANSTGAAIKAKSGDNIAAIALDEGDEGNVITALVVAQRNITAEEE